MKVKKIQCELCGSIEIIKVDSDTFQCSYCGCKYTAEQARLLISGVVEVVKGNAELLRQLKNAETQHKLKNFIETVRIYDELTKEFPAEHIVWKKYLEFYYTEIQQRKNFSILDDKGRFGYGNINYPELTIIQQSAISTCPSDELSTFKANIDSFWQKVYNDVISDNFSLLSPYYSWLNIMGNFHPLMKQLADECNIITAKLNKMRIYYGFPLSEGSGKESFWPKCFAKQKHDRICNISIIGWECVWLYAENGADYPVVKIFKLPFCAKDEQAFYDKVYEIAQNNLLSLSHCPFCKKGIIKTSIFGKKTCNTCKATIPLQFN